MECCEPSRETPKTPRVARPIRPGQCVVCSLPGDVRARLEMLRVGGASLDALAKEFGVSRDSVHRHCRNHLTAKRRAELMAGPAKVQELANAAADESRSLIQYLGIARSVLFSQFLNAAEAGDRSGVAFISGKLLEALRDLGKLTGELRQLSGIVVNNNTLNIIGSPEFAALSAGLLAIARTHPAAKADIIALLRGLDAKAELPGANGAPYPLIEAEAVHAA